MWVPLVVSTLMGCSDSTTPVQRLNSEHSNYGERQLWNVRRTGDVPAGNGFRSIQFLNSSVGWVASPEKLWVTTNGGVGWELLYSADSGVRQISSTHFIDENRGFLLRLDGLYKTVDGGRTWSKLPTPFDEGKGDLRFFKVKPDDGTIGWVGGGIFRPISQKELKNGVPNNIFDSATRKVLDSAMFRSDDGGVHWNREPINAGLGRFHDMYIRNDGYTVVLGNGIYFYDDRVRRWLPIGFDDACVDPKYRSDYEGKPVLVYFVDRQTGWISFNDGRLVRSTNGGRTWCDFPNFGQIEFALPFDRYLKTLHFSGSINGWALSGDGYLYETNDGGAGWHRVMPNLKFDDMYFVESDRGWLIGEQGLFVISEHSP